MKIKTLNHLEIYNKIRDKFVDKGEEQSFHWLVLNPPSYDPSRLIEPTREVFNKIVLECYGQEWDYLNTWIDYQKHR